MDDEDDLRDRLAQLGRAQDGDPTPARGVARPARPATPTLATNGASRPPVSSAPPQAPQLSNAPARPAAAPTARPVAPMISTPPVSPPIVAADDRSHELVQTLLPPCLTLGVTLPLMAAGWFALDRFSMLRANALGYWLPASLFALGAIFLSLAAVLWARSAARPPSV